MKTIFKTAVVALAALFVVTSLEAAPKQNEPQSKHKNEPHPKKKSEIVTTKYSADVDCKACEAKVNRALTPIKGIKSVDVNLREKSITVKYDKHKVESDEIKRALSKVHIKTSPYKAVPPRR